ncbi:hypothetical protein QQX98_007750 [Neonectria punicea]|uniref:Uncharacterized protein n=1 Tax=Neonectria punicea TaxID=979145 RepID=A0ABR1GXF3_9HYPO
MSSRNSQSPRSARSPLTGLRLDVLEKVRILEQARENPYDTPDIPPSSRTFRVAAFALNLGLSMLECPRGRQALEITGTEVWRGSTAREQRSFIFQGDVSGMPQFVDRFLTTCRYDPPNVIVSDRITGEGLAQRVGWPGEVGGGGGMDDYTPKLAAVFRLNKTVIDNAIIVADGNDGQAWQKSLFLLGVAVAHELVHLFVGFMFGDGERLTPPVVNNPPGPRRSIRPGESGHFWENLFLGYRVEAYYDPSDPLESFQAGTLYTILHPSGRAFTIQHSSIYDYVNMDFSNMLQHRSDDRGRGVKITLRTRPMESNYQAKAGA